MFISMLQGFYPIFWYIQVSYPTTLFFFALPWHYAAYATPSTHKVVYNPWLIQYYNWNILSYPRRIFNINVRFICPRFLLFLVGFVKDFQVWCLNTLVAIHWVFCCIHLLFVRNRELLFLLELLSGILILTATSYLARYWRSRWYTFIQRFGLHEFQPFWHTIDVKPIMHFVIACNEGSASFDFNSMLCWNHFGYSQDSYC